LRPLEICEHYKAPDLIPGKFPNEKEDLQEEGEDCYQKISSIAMSINLEELRCVMVGRLYSIFASAVVMPHTCSNYSQKVFDTLQQLSPPEMWWII
jgi:hypothetical protein